MERAWLLDGEQFRQELLQQVTVGPGPSHYGEAMQESVRSIAERLLTEALKRRKSLTPYPNCALGYDC